MRRGREAGRGGGRDVGWARACRQTAAAGRGSVAPVNMPIFMQPAYCVPRMTCMPPSSTRKELRGDSQPPAACCHPWP